ncbi:MAG: hypothetical protein D6722_06945, partial [Bacteroidetes bacterium]
LTTGIRPGLDFIVPYLKPERDAFDELIQVEGRYNHLEKSFSRGVLSSDERDRSLNQIRASLLAIFNSLVAEDLRAAPLAADPSHPQSADPMLEKLRTYIEELEKLRQEHAALQQQNQKHKLKIIIQCEPAIEGRPNQYTCQGIILDDDTGEAKEVDIPLRREPGGLVATIHDLNPRDYVQLRITDTQKEWESDYFSPQFLTQTLRLVNSRP